jgi:hypothetical protein
LQSLCGFLVQDIFERQKKEIILLAAGQRRLVAAGCVSTLVVLAAFVTVVDPWFAVIALQGRRFRA